MERTSDACVGGWSPPSQRFRERLNQENFLIVQRVSWLLVSQSFLFIVYAALIVAKPSSARHDQAARLFYVVPVLGVVIVLAVYTSIAAAHMSIRALRRQFDLLEPQHPDPFDLIPTSRLRALGSVAAHVPPIAIAAVWIWLEAVGRY